MITTNLLKRFIAFAIIIITITTSCKRTEIPVTPDPTPTNPVGGPVNDAAQVLASVSGIVLDESNVPIANAVVTSGTTTTTTNSNGMFIFQNISLSKENGSITAVKAGFFKGVRSFKTTEGKNHTVRLQLMQRVLSGTVNAATGGTINSNGGATIIFPANAFVTSTGAVYTGVVSVYSRWIDPTAANLPFVIPGDLRGVNTTGVENILETYGMVGAELADASGNVLKIAPGKTATVSFPIPASLSATAPATIVLWHFDDASARWRENGIATKTGNNYNAQVDKFSFWNCDSQFPPVKIDFTLINSSTNTPLASTTVKIKLSNAGNWGANGITNDSGYCSIQVRNSSPLILNVISSCGIVYSQNIGSFTSEAHLGNINVSLSPNLAQSITFSGKLLDCNGSPINNGYVSFNTTAGNGIYASTTSAGNFTFSTINCSGSNLNYNYVGVNSTSNQQSAVITGSALNGTINLGNINTCSTSSNSDVYVVGWEEGYAKLWKNGVPTNIAGFNNSGANASSVYVSNNDVFISGYQGGTNGGGSVWKNGISTNFPAYTTYANSIFVSGNDVYVAGAEGGIGSLVKPKVWKNNVGTTLSNIGQQDSYANSVFVVGNDVYVAGWIDKTAVFWKNGLMTVLSNGTSIASYANSIYVAGTNVYVAGEERNVSANTIAKVWKNGVGISLTNAATSASAKAIFVIDTDVYVAGIEKNAAGFYVAKVWKNGIATSLTNGLTDAYTTGIFVKGADVYVSGKEINSSGAPVAKFWKNGLPTNLTLGAHSSEQANSIFVK
jgi:hypothetical protein